MAEKEKNRIRAAEVTSRPVRPIPVMTAMPVSPVRSYSSRIRDEDEDLVVHGQPEQEREDHDGQPEVDRPGGGDVEDHVGAVAELPEEHDRSEHGGQGDQVDQHGLERQQHGPEGADQQDVGDQGDQPPARRGTCRRPR